MARIPLFGIGIQGKSPKITAQIRQNCYFEIVQADEHTKVACYGTPGLESFVDFGDTPVRGKHSFHSNSRLYVVHRATLWEVDNAGVMTNRGTLLTSSGRVYMADNGTQICIVDGTDGYTYNTSSTAFARITDADFPANPSSVTCHNRRFIVSDNGTGQFYGSAISDGTSWAALDFATAESSPDNLVRVDSRDELVLWGDLTTEFWADTGSAGFPYARIPGTSLQWGLASRAAVAKFMGSLAFLAKSDGQVIVAKLNGFTMERLSDFELEHIINEFDAVNDTTMFAYTLGGHPMLQVNFPTGGQSWLYDGATKVWSKLKSANITRHRAEIHANFVDTNTVSDYENGKIYRLKSDVYTDNGESIEMELVGRHIVGDDDERVTVAALELIMETGVGLETGQGSAPVAMLQISKDGGHNYGVERWATIGAIGEYKSRCRWRRLGAARDTVYKIRITDPIPRRIAGTQVTFGAQ